MRTRLALTAACLAAMLLLFMRTSPVGAQSAAGKIDGFVVDQTNGLPIAGAGIALYYGGGPVQSAKSDAHGEFKLDSVAPGLYSVAVNALGYQASQSRTFSVESGQIASVNVTLTRASQSQPNELKTIGTVTALGTSALASTTTITKSLDTALVQKENLVNFGSAIVRLPGVNAGGLSSSVNDDLNVNIRGLGESETQALLDGHPVGPQGVYGINGGGSYPTAFNYADTPVFGLHNVQVTFGSGATGLYGVDAIGGTVDMQTLNPTVKPTATFWQGAGDQGRQQTGFATTGSYGTLSYALAGGVLGTYGMFPGAYIPQTGRPNNNANANNNSACTQSNDISPCNLALNTYWVSQDAAVRAGLAKLRFELSKNTSMTWTAYSSGQRADSTGNGDNDNMPYDTRLALIQSNPGNCALPGDPAGKKSGYAVITVANPANNPTACYTASQFALAASGPSGGGQDRNRGTDLADYDLKIQSISGKNAFIADAYYDYYKYYKSSEAASGLDQTGTAFAGTVFSQFLNTQGYLLADDIQGDKSDFGFGAFREDQLGSRLDYNVVNQGIFSWENPERSHYTSGFVRSSYVFNDKLSVFGNLWVKSDSVIGDTNFDPRVSLVLRPQRDDVFRVTFGHSTGDPAAELKATGPPSINANPSSLNPTCTPYNTIGSGGNPKIQPESANDYEVGYAHRFQGDSSVQINAYYTNVQNQLFSASEPVSSFGPVAIPPGLLAGFASKIASVCPAVNPAQPSTVLPFLAIATTYNAATAVSKGIEFSGRQRLTRHFYADYSYDLQSVVQNGVNDNILQNNAFIVSGGQVQGIPINQATAGLDYTNGPLEMRMDGYVVGTNNPSGRPPYNVWNGFISRGFPHGYTITLGVQNVFNQAWQQYGYFGHEPLIPENHFFNDTNSIEQFVKVGGNEEFGLPIRSFLLTFTSRV